MVNGRADERSVFQFKFVHCFSPNTAQSTHFFYANARNSAISDEAMTRAGEATTSATFMKTRLRGKR